MTEVEPPTENMAELDPPKENMAELDPPKENIAEFDPPNKNMAELEPPNEDMVENSEDDEAPCYVLCLPTELLVTIFSYLSGKQLTQCKQVCLRWNHIINDFTSDDIVWRNFVECEFGNVYNVSRVNYYPGLSWYDIYRSLSLWPYVSNAEVQTTDFAFATTPGEQIKRVIVLQDGTVGAHTKSGVQYYDSKTLKPSEKGGVPGFYNGYNENDYCIALTDFYFQIHITRKYITRTQRDNYVLYNNVKIFTLIDRAVYFMTFTNQIFKCSMDDDQMHAEFITMCPDEILSLGSKHGKLHILTSAKHIYILNDRSLVLQCTLESYPNMLQTLQKYDLLDQMDGRMYFQWLLMLYHTVTEGPFWVTIRSYGHIYFVGTYWGMLKIYYTPSPRGELDLFDVEPIQQYDFMDRCDDATRCPILMIDILEELNGHSVFVAMPHKISVLRLNHNFAIESVESVPISEDKESQELDPQKHIPNEDNKKNEARPKRCEIVRQEIARRELARREMPRREVPMREVPRRDPPNFDGEESTEEFLKRQGLGELDCHICLGDDDYMQETIMQSFESFRICGRVELPGPVPISQIQVIEELGSDNEEEPEQGILGKNIDDDYYDETEHDIEMENAIALPISRIQVNKELESNNEEEREQGVLGKNIDDDGETEHDFENENAIALPVSRIQVNEELGSNNEEEREQGVLAKSLDDDEIVHGFLFEDGMMLPDSLTNEFIDVYSDGKFKKEVKQKALTKTMDSFIEYAGLAFKLPSPASMPAQLPVLMPARMPAATPAPSPAPLPTVQMQETDEAKCDETVNGEDTKQEADTKSFNGGEI